MTTNGKNFQVLTRITLSIAFGMLPSQSTGAAMSPIRSSRWLSMP